jgi:hypothetical protein
LGEVLLPESFLCNTQAFTEVCYGEENHAVAYPWAEGQEPLEIFPEERKDFFAIVKEKIEARQNSRSHGDFRKIEIQLNNEFLKVRTDCCVIDL